MAERRRSVIWSPEARADLEDIYSYYVSVAGSHTAGKIVRAIGEACELLERHPYAGRTRNEVKPDLRCFPVTPHVIFYRLVRDTAQIVRVLDGRRDLDAIFADRDDA
jgi:toxin ParE1/3/4